MLARYLPMIQVQRQDFNGRMLTIRATTCAPSRASWMSRPTTPPAGSTTRSASASALTVGSDTPPFGVYVHVPFCAKRCDYCAFATWTDRTHSSRPTSTRVVAEIGRAVAAGLPEATCVFFGGGTPSLVPADALMRVLDHIPLAPRRRGHGRVQPRHGRRRPAARLSRRGGVNRLTFGVQSMVPHVLAALGRTHDPANVRRRSRRARGRVRAFNLDLIYGAAGESSTTGLTLDARARARPAARQRLRPRPSRPARRCADDPARHPDDDDQADKYLVADAARRRRPRLVRDLELGEARPRVPAQPPLLVAGRLPRVRVRGPLASRRRALVERAHARALHRGDHRGSLADGG